VHNSSMATITRRPVRRLRDRPIVEAGAVLGYGPLFNAGVLHHAGAYHLFVRAVRDGYRPGDGTGPRFVDYLSDIVVFTSADGLHYEYGSVLASAGIGGTLSFEDPRVQWLEDRGKQRLVMTYTQVPPPGDGPWRIGAHHLHWDGKRFEIEEATGQLLGPPDAENKDAVVFTLSDGHVALIHHVRSGMQLALFDNLEHLWHPPEDYWDAHLADLARHTLLDPSPGALSIGVGAPPVRSEAGSSCFFHERRAAGS
jgi:predicted GH43/DUF377 family glycosyl hydrolase